MGNLKMNVLWEKYALKQNIWIIITKYSIYTVYHLIFLSQYWLCKYNIAKVTHIALWQLLQDNVIVETLKISIKQVIRSKLI